MSVVRESKGCAALFYRQLHIIHIGIDHDLVSLARVVSVSSYISYVTCLEE